MKRWLKSLFYVPKYGKVFEKTLYSRLAASISIVALCMIGMSFTAFAYFSSSVSSSSTRLTGAYFDVRINIYASDDTLVLSGSGQKEYAVELKATESYRIEISSNGNAQTGFVIVKIIENTYHTQQLQPPEQPAIQFSLQLQEDQTVTFTPHWGTSSYYAIAGESLEFYLKNNQTHIITPTGDPDQALTDGPSLEPSEEPSVEPSEGPREASSTENT